jgi:hypothetical protein
MKPITISEVHLKAVYNQIHTPVKIDITPAEVECEYRFLFEEKTVPVMRAATQKESVNRQERLIKL